MYFFPPGKPVCPVQKGEAMFLDWEFMINSFPKILQAVPIALMISIASLLLGFMIGFLLAMCRMLHIPVLSGFAKLYVSFARGTPLLVNLYLVYFALPVLVYSLGQSMGWNISINSVNRYALAITAFALNSAAYISEIVRSSLSAINVGQLEACYSVGMTRSQALYRIVMPQAMAIAMPNLSNHYISLFKGTSLAYTVTIVEILGRAKVLASQGYTYLEAYIDVAIIYWVLCIVFENLFYLVEKRIKRFRTEIKV